MEYTILFPVVLPFIFGCLLPLLKPLYKNSKMRNIYVFVTLIVEAAAFIYSLFARQSEIVLWDMAKGLPICFKSDSLGMLFAAVTLLMWIMSCVFAFEYMKHEGRQIQYFTLVLLSLGALMGVCFAGNLVSAYIFYEFMSVFTMPWVLHSLSKESIAAAKKYLFYSMGGAFLGLSAFFVMFNYAGVMPFAAGGCMDRAAAAGHENIILFVSLLFIIGFGSKAGMWPLHGWLPSAHPVAPAPASALLSGNITKMGVLMIIRYIYYVVGADFIRGTYVQYVFMIFALLTVLMGSMMAYKEEILKKRLAYSTVSQVSYILFGLSCMNEMGMVGALMHVIFHSLVKNTLFLNAGAIIYKTGKTKVSELVGIGKEMPVTMWCFTLVSLTLVGIPPTSAFVSKWYLALGSLNTGMGVLSVLGPVILLTSALLTAGYLITITMKGFFPGEEFVLKTSYEPNLYMLIPMIIMTVLTVVFGIYPGPVTAFLESIAACVL